jgi:hypothetical protein
MAVPYDSLTLKAGFRAWVEKPDDLAATEYRQAQALAEFGCYIL